MKLDPKEAVVLELIAYLSGQLDQPRKNQNMCRCDN